MQIVYQVRVTMLISVPLPAEIWLAVASLIKIVDRERVTPPVDSVFLTVTMPSLRLIRPGVTVNRILIVFRMFVILIIMYVELVVLELLSLLMTVNAL